MPSEYEYVVLFGRDRMLLETREEVLKRAGYLTLSTTDAYLARECILHCHVSILILCHTLSANDVSTIVRFHHEKLSTATILTLSSGGVGHPFLYGATLDALEGSASLVAAVQRLSTVSYC